MDMRKSIRLRKLCSTTEVSQDAVEFQAVEEQE